jgi:rhodanese-related sulfurtransferase
MPAHRGLYAAALPPIVAAVLASLAPSADGSHQASVTRLARQHRGIAAVLPAQAGDGQALVTAIPKQDPSDPAVGQTIGRLRSRLPSGALIGGAVVENHHLQAALSAKAPLVIGVVLALGFLLLLLALQAPLIAAVGVITNLLATGAAFGVAKLVFQDGHLSGLLGFQSQGLLDAWGPGVLFVMIFAISMDYTVFLLLRTKEHSDRSHDPHEAMGSGVAHSARVSFAAGAVMVADFFTFALSGPAAAQGDGRHRRHRRPARRRARAVAVGPGDVVAARRLGLVAAEAARPAAARRPLRTRVMLTRLLRTLPSTSPREAAERLSRGELQLVNVREASKIAAADVPAAIHIPLGQLPASRRRRDHGRPVAFPCRSSRSATATRAALAAGLDATNASCGVTAWACQGHPLRRSVRTTDAPSPREPEHRR